MRWGVRAAVALVLTLIIGAYALSRSPLVARTVRSQVRTLTGAEISADDMRVLPNGSLVMRGVSFRAPGIAGTPGELVRVERAVLELDWSELARGRGVRPTALRMHGPIFRISQSLDDQSVNFGALRADPSVISGQAGRLVGGTMLPRIDVIDGRVEFREHSVRSGRDDLLNALRVAGAIIPMEQVAGAGGAVGTGGAGGAGNGGGPVYIIRLQEIGRRMAVPGTTPESGGSARGLLLDGRTDLATGESTLRLLNLSLNSWPPEAVASGVRDIWSRLNLRGPIRQATLEYSPTTGVRAVIEPSDVSMTVLIPREPLDGKPDAQGGPSAGTRRGGERGLLPLERVNGQIELSRAGVRADLRGVVDGSIPAAVTLTTEGLSLDAALRCEIRAERLNIEKNPEFLPYMPEKVRFYFRAFSGPTAEADARIVIQRARASEDGSEGAITVPQGQISMVNGTAAFHTFPYRFEKLRGRAEFSDSHLHIIEVTGENPNGARLRARAMVKPLTDDAEVEVEVRVDDVPWDDELLQAVGEPRNNVLKSVLWMPAYDDLVARGLVARPADPHPAAPVFEPGGRAAIDVRVLRPRGIDVDWSTTVDARLDRVGLLPRNFPYPIIAGGVALRVTDDRAELLSGVFRGLRGGAAEMTATVTFPEDNRLEPLPSITIDASAVPVDDLLIHALPGRDEAPPAPDADAAALSARDALQRLRVRGAVDCRMSVAPIVGGQAGELGYDITVFLRDVTASPMADAPAVGQATALTAITGRIGVTQERIRVQDLRGTLVTSIGDPTAAGVQAAQQPCGTISLDLDVPAGADASGNADRRALNVRVRAEDLDTSAPIERLVEVFAPPAAAEIARLRAAHAPAGVVGASVEIDQSSTDGPANPLATGTLAALVRVERLSDFSISALGGRFGTPDIDGPFSVRILPTLAIEFPRTAADVLYNGEPSGRVTLDGYATIGGHEGAARLAAPSDLRVSVTDARLESAVIRRLAGLHADAEPATALSGSFDGEARLTVADNGPLRVDGTARPRSLLVENAGRRLAFSGLDGHVRFQSDGGNIHGSLDGVRTTAADDRGLRASVDGDWRYFPEHDRLEVDALVNAWAGLLTDDLRAWLPQDARTALDALSMVASGPVELDAARVRVSAETSGARRTATRFDGPIRFEGVDMDIGVPLRGASGVLEIAAGGLRDDPNPTAGEPALQLRLRDAAMTIAGVPLSGVHADGGRRTQADQPGTSRIQLHFAQGDALGGRCWASGWVDPDHAGGPAIYAIEVLMAGVPVAPLLQHLEASQDAGQNAVLAGAALPQSREPDQAPPTARGLLDAALALTGRAGAPETRIGRGSARIAEGDVLRLPVIFPMLQVSNLILPSDDRLDYLQSSFHIEGARARFDELTVLSRTIALVGSGTVSLPDLSLDLRFNTRSNQRIPLFSALLEALRDEIVTTRVRGTVSRPAVSTESLPMTRRMVGQFFPDRSRGGATAPTDLGAGTQQRAQRERTRLERSADPHPPDTHPPDQNCSAPVQGSVP